MSFNIIIYNIFNFITLSFSFINFMISNIIMIIIIYNNYHYDIRNHEVYKAET